MNELFYGREAGGVVDDSQICFIISGVKVTGEGFKSMHDEFNLFSVQEFLMVGSTWAKMEMPILSPQLRPELLSVYAQLLVETWSVPFAYAPMDIILIVNNHSEDLANMMLASSGVVGNQSTKDMIARSKCTCATGAFMSKVWLLNLIGVLYSTLEPVLAVNYVQKYLFTGELHGLKIDSPAGDAMNIPVSTFFFSYPGTIGRKTYTALNGTISVDWEVICKTCQCAGARLREIRAKEAPRFSMTNYLRSSCLSFGTIAYDKACLMP
jgi:hypothetical protein